MIIKEHIGIPNFIATFIEDRYHNYRTTEVYIKEFVGLDSVFSAEMYDEKLEIRETFVYRILDKECTVLNELVWIEQIYAEQFSDFIFKKYKVKRIRFRKFFKPYKGDNIISYSNVSDFCIPLPPSKDEYDNSLGKKSLRNFKYYGRKLVKDFGDNLEIRINEPFDPSIDKTTLNDFQRLKDMRFRQKKNSLTRNKVEMLDRVASKYGRISSVKLNGELIGGWLRFVVGEECYEIILAYDIKYAHLNIVRVLLYQSIQDAIDEGCKNDHLLWGANDFKNLVGAKEIELYDSYFYKSRNISYYLGWLSVKKELLILAMKKNSRVQYLRKIIHKLVVI